MASEATIARDLRDARFQALRIPPAIDPSVTQTPQSAVERDIDGLRQARAERGALGAKSEAPRTRNFSEKLRSMPSTAQAAAKPGDLAKTAVNKQYTLMVDSWQSSLLTSTLALEVFISPWVFLLMFFMRVMASVVPVRLRGVNVIPPYTLKGGGIGVLISHLAGALAILVVLTIIFVIIALVAIFFTSSTWEKAKLIYDFGPTGLKVLYDLLYP
ncbi:MAG: hypothetical protein Q8O51_00310 [bacterium]|nr:hypothetical protein [bacterium]